MGACRVTAVVVRRRAASRHVGTATARTVGSTGVNAADITFTPPANWAAGDFAIVRILVQGNKTLTVVPPEWTAITGMNPVQSGATSTDIKSFWYYRIIQGGDAGTVYTWTQSASSRGLSQGVCYGGINTATTGLSLPAIEAKGSQSGLTLTGGLTTLSAGVLVVTGVGYWQSSTATTFTEPSGFTERLDTGTTSVFGAAADKAFAAAGSTGDITWTKSAGGGATAVGAVALVVS